MGFLTGILKAGVKGALLPVSLTKDVVNILTDDKVDSTDKLLDRVKGDIDKSIDDLGDGELF
jgi:hypothetical protein